jgi:hypothetical protein
MRTRSDMTAMGPAAGRNAMRLLLKMDFSASGSSGKRETGALLRAIKRIRDASGRPGKLSIKGEGDVPAGEHAREAIVSGQSTPECEITKNFCRSFGARSQAVPIRERWQLRDLRNSASKRTKPLPTPFRAKTNATLAL